MWRVTEKSEKCLGRTQWELLSLLPLVWESLVGAFPGAQGRAVLIQTGSPSTLTKEVKPSWKGRPSP